MLNRDFRALIIAILNRNRDREKIHLLLIYLFATIICVMTLFVERDKHNHCCKVIIINVIIIVNTILFVLRLFLSLLGQI